MAPMWAPCAPPTAMINGIVLRGTSCFCEASIVVSYRPLDCVMGHSSQLRWRRAAEQRAVYSTTLLIFAGVDRASAAKWVGALAVLLMRLDHIAICDSVISDDGGRSARR